MHISGVPGNVDTWGIGQRVGFSHFNFAKIGVTLNKLLVLYCVMPIGMLQSVLIPD